MINMNFLKNINYNWKLMYTKNYLNNEIVKFISLSATVLTCFILYSYVLELIFKFEPIEPYGWFVTMLQFGYYVIFSSSQIFLTRSVSERKISLKNYFFLALLTVGTMGFSNTAILYLNYPTQVVFKSCKLIPVMIGSVIILKKTYNWVQILACVCMSVGLIWFTLADSIVQPQFHFKGVLLICLALLCDAVIGNVQESLMNQNNESPIMVVLYSYFFGFIVIFFCLIVTQDFLPGLQFSIQYPKETFGYGCLLALAGYSGLQAVLQLIKSFGALVAVTVTTFRKAFSIVVSFTFFAKPFTIHYIWGGFMVAFGLYLSVIGKKLDQKSLANFSLKFYVKKIFDRFYNKRKIDLQDSKLLIA